MITVGILSLLPLLVLPLLWRQEHAGPASPALAAPAMEPAGGGHMRD